MSLVVLNNGEPSAERIVGAHSEDTIAMVISLAAGNLILIVVANKSSSVRRCGSADFFPVCVLVETGIEGTERSQSVSVAAIVAAVVVTAVR